MCCKNEPKIDAVLWAPPKVSPEKLEETKAEWKARYTGYAVVAMMVRDFRDARVQKS